MSPKNLENSAAEAVQLSPNEIPDSVARHLHKHDHVKYERRILSPSENETNQLTDLITHGTLSNSGNNDLTFQMV